MVDAPPDRCLAVPCLTPSEPLADENSMQVHPIDRTTAAATGEILSQPRLDQVWTIHSNCFDPLLHLPV